MITTLLPVAVSLLLGIQASGQTLSRPNVPEELTAPAGQNVVLVAHATGFQLYVCQLTPDDKFGWTLKAPDAELHDQQGAVIGQHFAGPTWKSNDGSQVTGKAIAKVDSPDPGSIPWLLLTATGHSGEGIFSHVSSVQRVNTKAGVPPPAADCTAAKKSELLKSPYTADYYFYAPGK